MRLTAEEKKMLRGEQGRAGSGAAGERPLAPRREPGSAAAAQVRGVHL